MNSFAEKVAIVTGGGSGMGRELVRQLAAEGCSVAACDLNPDSLAETRELALGQAAGTVLVTAHAERVKYLG
jgi:NAD(P)-dependent dehydrogenase (short-subunit alcohol dehydrogenase family)